ncbi:hypothetical protein ACWGHD_18935 [Streptomyces xanthophaeus]
MTRLVDAIQRAAETAATQSAGGWLLATVTAVNAGGTVDIDTATGSVDAVRHLRCCVPVSGDLVMVVTHPNGNWIVIDALAD